MLVKLPRPMRRLRIRRPLLVHKRSRVGQHAVIELRVIPRHDQRARASRAAAHRRPTIGIFRQLHVRLRFNQRQHFLLHKLGIHARHRVVLQPALAPLRIPAPVADRNRNHHRHLVLRNQSVQSREEQAVRPVRAHDERRNAPRAHTASAHTPPPSAYTAPDGSSSQSASQGPPDRASRTSPHPAQSPDRSCCPPSSS